MKTKEIERFINAVINDANKIAMYDENEEVMGKFKKLEMARQVLTTGYDAIFCMEMTLMGEITKEEDNFLVTKREEIQKERMKLAEVMDELCKS